MAAMTSGSAWAEPSSQWTTVTPSISSRSVPGRSGSARAASMPASSIGARPSSRLLVPRTAHPCRRRLSPSIRPRQPQPTINARAMPAILAYIGSSRLRRSGRVPRPRSPHAVCPRSISGAPRRRRMAFCASTICRTSSISFCASSSGERVGFQSTRSALLPGRSGRPPRGRRRTRAWHPVPGRSPRPQDTPGPASPFNPRMPEAYLVDAVRTPMGALPRRALRRAPGRPGRPRRRAPPSTDGRRAGADHRRLLRRRQPGRRGQPRRGADGGTARRAAAERARARPSTGSAPRASRRSTRPPARSSSARGTSTWRAASSR